MALNESRITFTIPTELLPLLEEFAQGKTAADNVKISLVIALFLAKVVSLGKAAEIAGLSLNDFIFLLQANGLPWKDYGEEDLQYDELAISEASEKYRGKP